jgi:hypothetical protein
MLTSKQPERRDALSTACRGCSETQVALGWCRHSVGEFSEQDSQRLCAYYVEQAVQARPPGVDTVLGVFDVAGFGLQNADPKRAGEVLMVDAPWAFMPPFNLMRPLLGKYADLIKFVSRREAAGYFKAGEAPADLAK